MTTSTFLMAIEKLTESNLTLGELITVTERLKAEGALEQVGQLYALWLKVNHSDPQRHVAQFNYAVYQSDHGQLQSAHDLLQQAIAQNPDFYPAYINLGNVLERSGKVGEAINLWTAMANRLGQINGLQVGYKLSAMKQIGRALEANRLFPQAEHVLQQSLEIHPAQQDVLQHYTALRLLQCEWPVIKPWGDVTRKILMKGVSPLSMAVYTDDPMMQCASGWHYCKHFIGYPENDLGHTHGAPHERAHKGKLKIGYVSSDLRNHAVGFIMAELFGLHDRKHVEVIAYFCGTAPQDAMTDRIKNTVDHWVDITTMSDEQAAHRIKEDGIDILVDVNGYTKDARTRVFAMRPAPVIVNWLGFPGTMGSPYHHYIIADASIIPPEHEKYFTEKVMRLPCYQPNDRARVVAERTPTRAEMGLPEDAFVFCSFNGLQKLSRFTFDRWLNVMAQVENSVLWLLDGAGEIPARLRAYAAQKGIAPERFIFAGKMANPDHLARYKLADLFLDNQPYGAHVTASDALWMGVPILTLEGRGFAARVTASLVRAAGMPELVCSSEQEFISRAVALGRDKAEVRRLKMKLAANRDSCVLFDTPKLVQELEKLYAQMWDEYRRGALPVPDLSLMETYHDIGSEFDHEAIEMRGAEDYEGLYRTQLAKRHRYHPIAPDHRLWNAEAIATLEGVEAPKKVVNLAKKKK